MRAITDPPSDESTSSAAIISWTWDFGDGNTSNQPNPSHTYTSVGRYEVSLTILDAEGCQAVISGDSIFVGEQIDVDFIYDVNEACIPDAIITTNLSDQLYLRIYHGYGNLEMEGIQV